MQHYFVKKVNDQFVLDDADFHHVKNVMRMKSKDQLVCIYNQKSYLCEINFSPVSYTISVIQELEESKELPIAIELYQALIKNDKFDFVVQKATEIGVSKIIPTICARSIIKVDATKQENKLQRYQKIMKEACEQSRRTFIPQMSSYCYFKDIKLDSDTLGILAYENQNQPQTLNLALKDIKNYKKVAIVIGPEGGFEENEVRSLMQKGFHCVSLGNRILRSETAAIYAMSVVAYTIEGVGNN